MMLVLGLDTSCDETAAAVLADGRVLLSNVVASQLIHAEFGGVVPEYASRAHMRTIVPIVIRNAGELMWRSAATIHAGTVQIAVLPPVATTGWVAEELDKQVQEIRGQYLATLANWPARGSGRVEVTEPQAQGPASRGARRPPPAVPLA